MSVVVGSSGCQWLLAAVGVSGGWQQWVVVYNSRCGHRVLLDSVPGLTPPLSCQRWVLVAAVVVVYNSRCGHRVLLEKVGLKCILKACFLFF